MSPRGIERALSLSCRLPDQITRRCEGRCRGHNGGGDGLTWTTLETCGLLWTILDFSGLTHLFHHMLGTQSD
jgi:hypothetical protein